LLLREIPHNAREWQAFFEGAEAFTKMGMRSNLAQGRKMAAKNLIAIKRKIPFSGLLFLSGEAKDACSWKQNR